LMDGYLMQYPWDQLAPSLSKDDVKVGSDDDKCGPAFTELCKTVTPGLGRAATCLRQHLQGNLLDMSKLSGSKSCKIEVNRFFSAARKDITKYNTALAKACSVELADVCKGVATGAGGDFAAKKKTPFACLKSRKKKLSEECAAEVFQEQVAEAEDVRLDNGIMAVCDEDIKTYCAEAKPDKVMECLSRSVKKNKSVLRPECGKAVFGNLKEQAEDIRLDPGLFGTCAEETKGFCADVKFGDAKKKKCLFSSRTESGFGEPCKVAIEKEMGFEAKDARLNVDLSKVCDEDLATLCAAAVTTTAASADAPEGSSIECMLKNLKRLKSKSCKKEVSRVGAVQAELWNANVKVEAKCQGDVDKFCSATSEKKGPLGGKGKKDGGGVEDSASAVQDCLRAHLSQLSPECRSAEFKELQVETQSLELKPGLLRACAASLKQCTGECGDSGWATSEGAACALTCLRAQVAKDTAAAASSSSPSSASKRMLRELSANSGGAVNARCKQQLELVEVVATSDYRLMPGLPEHCAGDISRLCDEEASSKGPNGEGPAGVVLECLAEKVKLIKDKKCAEDARAVKARKAEAPTADAFSASACKQDAALFCPGVEGPGLHECLQKHVALLDHKCRHVEFEAAKAATSDVAFNPQLKSACRATIKGACGEADGPEDLLRCLEDLYVGGTTAATAAAAGPGRRLAADGKDGANGGGAAAAAAAMTAKCSNEVGKLVKLKNKDYRLNPVMADTCGEDMQRLCPAEKKLVDSSEALGDGKVIDCLVDRREEVRQPACSEAVKRKMLQRVVDASNDPAMLSDCGAEIEALCFDIAPGKGNLHRCLFQDHYNYLSDKCRTRELKYQAMKRSDVELNPLLREHCAPVLRKHCSSVQPGEATMKCLEQHMETAEASPPCRARVLQEPILRAKSLLLNPELERVCKADLADLASRGKCGTPSSLKVGGGGDLDDEPGGDSVVELEEELGGRDVACLLANEESVNDLCQTALLNVKRARSKDLRANPGGLAACSEDMEKFCEGETFGKGGVNRCLQSHLGLLMPESLNEGCAALQTDILMDEARDFVANPLMEVACANEREQFCGEVVDGSSRVQTCLSNKAKTSPRSMSGPCLIELERVWFSLALANKLLAAVGPHVVVGLKDQAHAWFAWATMGNLLWLFKAAMVCVMAAFTYATALILLKNKYIFGAYCKPVTKFMGQFKSQGGARRDS